MTKTVEKESAAGLVPEFVEEVVVVAVLLLVLELVAGSDEVAVGRTTMALVIEEVEVMF